MTHRQTDVDKIYTYLETLATHTVSSLLLHPSTLREILENIKRGMAQCPQLPSPNDLNQEILSYYDLHLINLIAIDDHLAIILQAPLADKSLSIEFTKFTICQYFILFCRKLLNNPWKVNT